MCIRDRSHPMPKATAPSSTRKRRCATRCARDGMIVGIDGRIALATGRGWGRYTRELIDALVATEQVELRILAPESAEATAWASHLRATHRVQVDVVPFDPA